MAVEVLLGQPRQVDAAFTEHGAELLVGQHQVDGAVDLVGVDLELSGDAGTDVDDFHLPGKVLLDKSADRHHRRDDADEVAQQLRIMALDQVDDRRTVAGEHRRIGIGADQLGITVANHFNARRTFVDLGKSELADPADKLSRADVTEKRGKGAAENSDDRDVAIEKLSRLVDAANNDLGLLRAELDANAAADAALVNDFRPVGFDLDRLDRTIAHAGVALAAVFADGFDRTHMRSLLARA